MDRRTAAILAARVAALLMALVGWELVGRANGGLQIPTPGATLAALISLAQDGTLWKAIAASNVALLIGFPVACVVGIGVGLVLGRRRIVDRAFSYYVDILMVMPMVAVVPAMIVALGLTLTARVAVVVLFALPVIVLNARAAVRIIDQPKVEMARSFAARNRQIWTMVILPAALGPIFAGLRQGLARGVSGMIVVELTLLPVGIGGLIVDYRSSFETAPLFAATLVVLVEGMVLVSFATAVERRIDRRLHGG